MPAAVEESELSLLWLVSRRHGGSVTQTSHLSAARADPKSFTTCGVPPYPAADDDASQSQARTTGSVYRRRTRTITHRVIGLGSWTE
jgi:hypothetical protein